MTSIAVVIPTHNSVETIDRALESVSAQSLRPSEVIVVDDGSADSTVEHVERHGSQPRLLHSTCGNGAGTRNIGIRAADAEWIAFLDSDDYWTPDHLRNAVDLLDRSTHDDVVAYMAHRWRTRPGSDRVETEPTRYRYDAAVTDLPAADFPEAFLDSGLLFATPSTLMHRGRLLEVGMFDESQRRRHDIDLWFRVIADHRWAYHPEAGSICQIGTRDSISSNVVEREWYMHRAVRRNADSFPVRGMRRLERLAARRSCAAAIAEGSANEIERAVRDAKPSLTPPASAFASAAAAVPFIPRTLIRLKRRWGRSRRPC